MNWRDRYPVHPFADRWPMLREDELAKLVEDIKQHGVRMPIGFYDETDASGNVTKTWLIDGRNRLEAAERAGVDIETIPTIHVHCGTAIGWILSFNAHRRHLTKGEIAVLIVEGLKQEEANKPRHGGEVSAKGGRGKVNKLKAAAIETAKQVDISPRTVERSMAKAVGKKAPARSRRRPAQIKCDRFFDSFLPVLEVITESTGTVDDVVIATLTKKQRAQAVETVKKAIAALTALLDELQPGESDAA